MSQGLSLQVSSMHGGGEREFVSGLGSRLSSIRRKGSYLGHNMYGISGLGLFIKFGLIVNNNPSFR